MMGLLLAVGMLVDNAVVVVEASTRSARSTPTAAPGLDRGTRHVAIALSAGTLCHCIVFLPMMFGEKNMLTIYLTQLAVTIRCRCWPPWLVAISLIPMLSARMQTPPAVKSPFISRLQVRYARCCAGRWSTAAGAWPASC